MKLTDLDPQWLMKDGRRVGFIFTCPTNPDRKMTCLCVNMAVSDQMQLWEDNGWDAGWHIQPCKKVVAWNLTPPIEQATFENISVHPSIDGSPAGNWHGFIKNGQIDGGL